MSSDSTLGPQVLLIRVRFDGRVDEDYMPALLAADALMNSVDNGTVYESGWVVEDPDNNISGWVMSACLLPIEIDEDE